MTTATPTLTSYLLDLWRASELYVGEEIKMTLGGTLFTAWDIDQQRNVLKFIVDRPRSKREFDDLSLDLAVLLHTEGDGMRDDLIADGYSRDEALDMVNSYGAYYMDVYLPTAGSAAIRHADLLGVYAPELFLHFAPDNLMIEGNAAGIEGDSSYRYPDQPDLAATLHALQALDEPELCPKCHAVHRPLSEQCSEGGAA